MGLFRDKCTKYSYPFYCDSLRRDETEDQDRYLMDLEMLITKISRSKSRVDYFS